VHLQSTAAGRRTVTATAQGLSFTPTVRWSQPCGEPDRYFGNRHGDAGSRWTPRRCGGDHGWAARPTSGADHYGTVDVADAGARHILDGTTAVGSASQSNGSWSSSVT